MVSDLNSGDTLADFDHFAEALAGASVTDCEYDNDFLALSQAVAGKPERHFGDTVIPAVDPDWREVDSLARALLGARGCTDCRVASQYSPPRRRGFFGRFEADAFLCERYWDDVHPRVVVDGSSRPLPSHECDRITHRVFRRR